MSRPAASTSVQGDGKSVGAQMLGDRSGRLPGIQSLLVGNCHDADLFSLFEDGKRIGEGPCGSPTEVPGHNHGIQCELTGLFARVRDYEGRTPRAKYDRLRVPLVAVPSLWHGHNRQISKACVFRKQTRNIQRQSVLQNPFLEDATALCGRVESRGEDRPRWWSSSLPPPPPWLEDRAQDRPESCPGLETRSRRRWRKFGLRWLLRNL